MFGIFAILGTVAAMLSVIGNDCVQTLSTFIQSCSKRKASGILMSLFLSVIFVGTLCYGYFIVGDVSFGRLEAIPYQTPQLFHIIPLMVLVILTYIGIPVSTTFIVLSVFSTNAVILQMVQKSVIGGTLAFSFGFCIWSFFVRFFDERKDVVPEKYHSMLIGIQTVATGILLVAWIMHDIANIMVFLPRSQDLGLSVFLMICLGSVAVICMIVAASGGRIQKIVANKSGTNYVFSAILIDIFYAFVLFFLKGYSHIPMSTTWAFIGLILGRECAMAVYHDKSLKKFLPIARKDIYKLVVGGAISILVVEIVHSL